MGGEIPLQSYTIDYSNWAVVSYKDDTGLGREAANLRRVLGVGIHIVIPSQRLQGHPLEAITDRPLAVDADEETLERVLEGLEGLLVLERPFHPKLLQKAKQMGLKTVAVPNWEWFNGKAPEWTFCDLFLCQSVFTETVLRSYGWTNTAQVPVVLDLKQFPPRVVSGKAKLFVHNAGLVDADDRKGTRDTIKAFMLCKVPDIRLQVRLQKEVELPRLDERVQVLVGNLADPADLYVAGDVAIQPSKMEGIGFMVIEPMAVGMPVITLDYPPMNEYIRTPELLVRKRWFKRKSFATNWIAHAHLRLPDLNDLARTIQWAANNDVGKISQFNRARSEQMFSRENIIAVWTAAIQRVM